MGEWILKEEWVGQQQEKKRKEQEKPSFIIPPDVLKIINPNMLKDDMESFLICICSGIKNIYSISNRIVKMRCTSCGMEYGYPDDHYYFNIKKSETEVVQQTPNPTIYTTAQICTCRKCQFGISEQQAKSSLDFVGQELCEVCVGAELA